MCDAGCRLALPLDMVEEARDRRDVTAGGCSGGGPPARGLMFRRPPSTTSKPTTSRESPQSSLRQVSALFPFMVPHRVHSHEDPITPW